MPHDAFRVPEGVTGRKVCHTERQREYDDRASHSKCSNAPRDQSEWYDASREALQTIAEGATQLAGFGVAAISVARDDGRL